MQWSENSGIRYLSETTDNANTAVIFFHGYGADADDLAPLSRVIGLSAPTDWYFPQGVLEVPIGPMMTGRGWFSIENRDWDALNRGEIDDTPFTPAIKQTLSQVTEFLDSTASRYKKVIVGGFSQGAILTSHTFYRINFVPKGLVLMSGYLVSPSEFPTISDSQKVPFFQSHGGQDQVLPVSGARKLHGHLNEMGLPGDFLEFTGGHEIPMDVLAKVTQFLKDQL